MNDLPEIKLTKELQHQVEIKRCEFDCAYFIQEYVKIEDRDTEGIAIPFHLWEGQRKVLNDILSERLTQIMKANQLGLTWLIIAYAAWLIRFNPGKLALAISETELKAKEIIRRVDFILRNLPKWMITDSKTKTPGLPYFEYTTLIVTIFHPDRVKDKEKVHQEDLFYS